MKKRIYVVASIIILILIIVGVMLSIQMTNKNIQTNEQIGKVEETQSVSTVQALETEPQVPETWDLTKVDPVLSEDNIYVPVPKGWTISTSEDERYVNGNVTKKGTISNLTFTSTGDYPWTENSSNIWVSGNKQVPNSTSELISNEIEVGENGGWVQIEWSVCSQIGRDILSMTLNDTVNGTAEQLPKEISGKEYGTAESSLIYTKCGKELSQGKYTISIKYTKYNNTTHTGLDSGYVKSGTYIEYDENGAENLAIRKSGGFVIYEGAENIDDLWTASKERNQFVWVPVPNSSRIYKVNETTGKIKAIISGNIDSDTKSEPGILSDKRYDGIRSLSQTTYGGYSKDIFYKDLETEYKNTIRSIEKYGGFYIGRYETGNLSSDIPVVKRLNGNIADENWYNMFPKMRNISNNSNIQTGMIWGSLYDETLQWLIDTEEKTVADMSYWACSSKWGIYQGKSIYYYGVDGVLINNSYVTGHIPSGGAEFTKANNIYDLCGNVWDGTMAGYDSSKRAWKGVSVDGSVSSYAANKQYGQYPDADKYKYPYPREYGYRAYMYIK